VPNQAARELVITVTLPDDKGRSGDGRSKVHRFRSHWLEFGQRLRDFRARYGVTQTEIARAIGAADASTVAQWESGVNVPEGLRREHLIALLDGQRWSELRAAALAGDGLPAAWDRGARWFRRASRERRPREMIGAAVTAVLAHLQDVVSPAALRQRYCAHDGEWVRGVAVRPGLDEEQSVNLRRLEDAAYGLRWLELTHARQFDLRKSLVPQLSLGLLNHEDDPASDGARSSAADECAKGTQDG
jgi:transcriptional regulator with XRE-family HTH domain